MFSLGLNSDQAEIVMVVDLNEQVINQSTRLWLIGPPGMTPAPNVVFTEAGTCTTGLLFVLACLVCLLHLHSHALALFVRSEQKSIIHCIIAALHSIALEQKAKTALIMTLLVSKLF